MKSVELTKQREYSFLSCSYKNNNKKCIILIEVFLFSFRYPGRHGGEQRVRQLWLHLHSALEARRHGPLSLQRLRPLQQNEWSEQAIN